MFSQLRVLDASKMLRFIRVLLENFLITGVKAVAMPKLLVLFLSSSAEMRCFVLNTRVTLLPYNKMQVMPCLFKIPSYELL